MITKITSSSLNKFLACQRAYFYRYELGLMPVETAEALSFGKAFHAAMEARNKGMTCEEALADGIIHVAGNEQSAATLSGLVYGYFARYKDDQPLAIKSEINFTHKIGKYGFRAAGVIDGLAELNGGYALLEYKTTSQAIDTDSDYWVRLRSNIQLNQYVDALETLGYPVREIVYDVTRKPAIRPKQNETLEDYSARLFEDCAARPDFYFAQRRVSVLSDDLERFRTSRREICYQIAANRKRQKRAATKASPWLCCNQQITCNSCEFKVFCLHGMEATESEIPTGFYVGERNPELKQKI
ncbi:MAG: hypothetical protein EOM51_11105 [Clostridia bacterium]|nr:hypothetical protein [Clostridia bacterium]